MADEKFYIRVRGREQGPFDFERLRLMVRRGQLGRLHEISSDGSQWTRADDYPELFAFVTPVPLENEATGLYVEVGPEAAPAAAPEPMIPVAARPAAGAWAGLPPTPGFGPADYLAPSHRAPSGAYHEPPIVSGLAITSLVLSFLWLCGVGSLLAVVFGFLALGDIRRSKGRRSGNGLAITGLCLGLIGLTITGMAVVIFFMEQQLR